MSKEFSTNGGVLSKIEEKLSLSAECLKLAANLLCNAFSLKDIEKALAPKVYINLATKLLTHFYHHLKLFNQKEANKLLPYYKGVDLEIKLQPGKLLPAGQAHNINREELLVLKKYLMEQLEKSYYCPSKSPIASPILFARKPGGGLRFCMNYRALNNITIKNWYLIPII